GYHWGFDWLAAILFKLLPISSLNLYFRLLPLVMAFVLGVLSLWLGRVLTKRWLPGVIFVFLNFFAGSFGYWVTLIREGSVGGESLFWAMQSISTLINPPFALSLVILLLLLLVWHRVEKKGQLKWALVLGLGFASLALIKVYAGVVAGLGLAVFALLKRRRFDWLICLVAGSVSVLLLIWMGVWGGPSVLVFRPLWFPHTLVESLDKLYWPVVAVLRSNLQLQAFSWKLPFWLGLELFLVLVFLLGNMGTRILGLIAWLRVWRQKSDQNFHLLLSLILGFGLILPLLFVQSGTSWNTIQFFYYFLFGANLYLALFLDRLWTGRRYWLFFLVLGLTIPTTLSTLRGYLGNPPPASAPVAEVEGLTFLRQQSSGVVLTYPFDPYLKGSLKTPIPLYRYETTAYVSALSGQSSFMEDQMNLEITNYPWQERKQEMEKFFASSDSIWARGFLLNNQIDYLYLVDDQQFVLPASDLGLEMIFDNGPVRIYRVQR
ncbi:MAG: hypothetical protein ABID04_04270, partial [Patescibacteria group bacterium]